MFHESKVINIFGVYWVSVIAPSRLPRVQSVQKPRYEIRTFWRCFYYVIEKFIDRLETKKTDVDPSVAGQHVRSLKNNYFKACSPAAKFEKKICSGSKDISLHNFGQHLGQNYSFGPRQDFLGSFTQNIFIYLLRLVILQSLKKNVWIDPEV